MALRAYNEHKAERSGHGLRRNRGCNMIIDTYLEIFGRNVRIEYDFEISEIMNGLAKLHLEIKTSKIIDTCSYDLISWDFEKRLGYRYFFGTDVLRWINDQFNVHWRDLTIEDKEWTENRNKDLTGKYYIKIRFNDEVQQKVAFEAERLYRYLKELKECKLKEQTDKLAAEEEEKAKMLNGVKWETATHNIYDEGGKTVEYTHTLTINGNTYKIIERNVFDFGRVLNSPKGGMYSKIDGEFVREVWEHEQGWTPTNISPDEAHAVEIIFKYGCFSNSSVRM